MSQCTKVATIIGVSYVDLVEEGFDDKVEEAAAEVGLWAWGQMPRFDELTDMYVGVVFYDRPTDAEVAEAIARVQAALPKLTEMLGAASSDIETWAGVSIG